MLHHAKNGTIQLHDTEMDYISFGNGEKTLVLLPGLGDGLRSMKGTALPMSLMYRNFAQHYRVYAFSRKNKIPKGYSTRDMARDQSEAMDALGIQQADVIGVSMGGMIAQWLAIDHPERVGKLVLVVTSAEPNPLLTASVTEWMAQARKGDHTALMDSNVKKIYSEAYYQRNKWLIPIMGKVSKPKSYERFLLQANACLTHDAKGQLPAIKAKTLVIGGQQDQVLGAAPSVELAQCIPGSKRYLYAEYGHGLYEEAKDFKRLVLNFLKEQ